MEVPLPAEVTEIPSPLVSLLFAAPVPTATAAASGGGEGATPSQQPPPPLLSALAAALSTANNRALSTVHYGFSPTLVPPYRFVCHPLSQPFPAPSPVRRSTSEYDSYVPQGVLQAGWMAKQQRASPALAVFVFEFDVRWRPVEWAGVEASILAALGECRPALSARGTDCHVCLIQDSGVRGGGSAHWDDRMIAEVSGERITALRKKGGLEGGSVTLLFTYDVSAGAPSHALTQFEALIREKSAAYYAARKRRLKKLVQRVSWTMPLQAALKCRLFFKLGHFSEFRGRPIMACKYYQAAYGALTTAIPGASETLLPQLKGVGEVITYKLLSHYLMYVRC